MYVWPFQETGCECLKMSAILNFDIKAIANGVEFSVLANPGSSRSCVSGVHGNALKVAVRAAPENGKANAEIESVLAEFLELSDRQVNVISGLTSRQKCVQALGTNVQAVITKLGAIK